MPADLVFGVVGMNPDAPCQVLFVESLRDQFKFAYEMVRTELQKSARWQKTGYDTGLKARFFKVGDKVVCLHEPLSNVKLASNWDGPFVVTRVVSDCTVVIRSEIGRMYKSNVSRLRAWRGREMSTKMYGVGLEEILSGGNLKDMVQVIPKKGPGRPRKVVKPVVKRSSTQIPTKRGRPKKVSPSVGPKKRKVQVKTIPAPEKALPEAGLKKGCREGTRRSPRLLERAAVT